MLTIFYFLLFIQKLGYDIIYFISEKILDLKFMHVNIILYLIFIK